MGFMTAFGEGKEGPICFRLESAVHTEVLSEIMILQWMDTWDGPEADKTNTH